MIDFRGARVEYGGRVALDAGPMRIERGERVAVRGANGAGKTTLLRELAKAAKGRAAFMPQEAPAGMELAMRARDYVMLGRTARLSAWRGPAKEDIEAVESALALSGLLDRARARVGEFSGGERRRLMVALAVASGAEALILDEPFAHLDEEAKRAVCGMLLAGGRTVVASVHGEREGEGFFTREIFLKDGKIAENDNPEFRSRTS